MVARPMPVGPSGRLQLVARLDAEPRAAIAAPRLTGRLLRLRQEAAEEEGWRDLGRLGHGFRWGRLGSLHVLGVGILR